MPCPALPRFSIHTLRTFIINIITLSVFIAFRRNRRRNPDIPAGPWPAGADAPFVQIIVPARNEANTMPGLLTSLLAQSYPAGRWSVLVVDDGSEDGTAGEAERVAAHFARTTGTQAPL